ncbi:ATP phosphoribosyltransferase regulatory subunit [Microbacterium sp. NIBRBAC000506063]|nr:ATP phosphoribosyltransferase regulatory subunit [Microbacterium sp. NIBRBAC000506063]
MRDILPGDKSRRERVLAVIRDRYRAHGFDEIEAPVLEEYSRLHAGIGGDNEKLAYNVLRRGLDADKIRAAADDPAALSDLGLRYDLTVPLARFYASNRGQLPGVFRAIQIGPVWRAERPQKGRYRQFVQCDIDIIGDDSARAEAELLVASLDALDALGLDGGSIRINDRRVLDWMLDSFGFAASERPGVLITIDKLDKIGPDGVVAELAERGPRHPRWRPSARSCAARRPSSTVPTARVRSARRSRRARRRRSSRTWSRSARRCARHALRQAQGPRRARGRVRHPARLRSLPRAGMGYYTGTIFEVAHPSVDYSLGGGGRYDGMIGRFLGQDASAALSAGVPAVGFSLGFERLVDLVALGEDAGADAVVLVHDADVPLAELAAHKTALLGALGPGARVRLERRAKNMKALLERAASDGYTAFATLSAGTAPGDLETKPLS